ncbi:MAG: hypothetical protein AAFS10_25530, partial [Myxococcota bacterium]
LWVLTYHFSTTATFMCLKVRGLSVRTALNDCQQDGHPWYLDSVMAVAHNVGQESKKARPLL